RDDLASHGPLAVVVDRNRSLDEAQRHVEVLPGLDQGERILRKAAAAVARTRVEELRTDAVVEPDAPGHRLDISADLLAEIRDFVDEGDLHREEGVSRILDQFGCATAGEHQRSLVKVK